MRLPQSDGPRNLLPGQVLANAYHARGDLSEAELALRHSLQLAPSATAHNNLAHVLQERGCLTEAQAEISQAERMADADTHIDVLVGTRAAIDADTNGNINGCGFDN